MSTATEKQLAIERAIAHRRCVVAVTALQRPLIDLRPRLEAIAQPKVLAQIDKVERWLDACIEQLSKKKFSRHGNQQFDATDEFFMRQSEMDGMSIYEQYERWCALYMAGMFLLWDCRISCKQYADNQQWTYLDMTATTLGNMLMQMAPGCDEAGTTIYMALHGYEWDTTEPQQLKEAA